MLLIALRKGACPCSTDCPHYAEQGWVRGVNGVPLKTHCRATMQPVIVDCDVYDPNQTELLEVSEEQWQAMQQAIRRNAHKLRKPYDPNHEEIHPVGYNWRHDRWNAAKSANVKSLNNKH